MNLYSRPKVGVLFISAKRFRQLGEGTADGTYEARKLIESKSYLSVSASSPMWYTTASFTSARMWNAASACSTMKR